MKKILLSFLLSFLVIIDVSAAPCPSAGSYNTSALAPSAGNEGKIPGYGASDKPCTGNVAVYFTPTQVKSAANLSNVDNTSDANKPISTATQTALNSKASNTLAQNKILVGNVSNIATPVDLSNDATIVASGALTISNNAITTAKIANNAVDLTTKVTGILPNANTTAEEYTGFPNSPFSIVRRDVDGLSTSNYADDASRSLQINYAPTTSSLRSYIPFFSNVAGGTETPQVNSGLSVIPSTGNLSATTFTGSGSGLTNLNASNISTGTIANARTTAEEYNAVGNTPFSIVSRDVNGTAWVNVANAADTANTIGIAPDTTDTLSYPVIVNNTGPSFQSARTASGFNFNVVTNTLSASTFLGNGNLTRLTNLVTNGFVKTSGGNGTLSVDTNTYLTGNQSITLSGDVSGTGTTAITTAVGSNKVLNSMLAQSPALSLKGNATNATANVTDIAAATDGQVMRRSGTTIGFGQITLNSASTVTGTLPVANGGTGTATAFTSGALVIAGASGIYGQDFSGVNFDTTNNRLAINKATAADFSLEAVGAIAATDGAAGASAKQMTMGYDTVNDWGTLSSIHQGVAGTDIVATTPNFRTTGNFKIDTIGKGYQHKKGTNGCAGTSTLVGGTVTVPTTCVTANSQVRYWRKTNGGTPNANNFGYTIIAGVSFTLTTAASDTSVYDWEVVQVNP